MDYLTIEGVSYDISKFKHPGGSLIKYYNKKDATDAFREFHYRSLRATRTLRSLPTFELPSGNNTHQIDPSNLSEQLLLENFRQFRKDLEEQGFFKPSLLHLFLRISELLFIFILAIIFIDKNVFLSLLLFGLFSGRCGWIQHEGGHSSLTGITKLDKAIQDFFIGFGLLTDGSMWNLMHNKHHATPQKVSHDMDLDTAPLVAFYIGAFEDYNQTKNFWSRLWIKFQAFTFIPITSGILVMAFWLFYLHPRKMLRDTNLKQIFLVTIAHAFRTFLFLYFGRYSVLQSYGLCLLSMCFGGMYLFGHFSLSHTFTPVVSCESDPSWLRYAIDHTVDINPDNPLVNYIMGYLNCQVVHHLFPTMPQFRQPQVSRQLKTFCKQNNLDYKVIGYFEAWKNMLSNLHHVGHHYYHQLDKKTD